MNRKDVLVTEHLVLRKPKIEDIEPMFKNWASDPEVTKYLTWLPHEDISVTTMIVNNWLEQEKDIKTMRYMITVKGSDEPIGTIDVVDYENDIHEIGYCLSRKHWGKGYMTEACKAFVNHLFELGYNSVVIAADVRNIGSNRVIEKCGFTFTHQEHLEHCSSFKDYPVTTNRYIIKNK